MENEDYARPPCSASPAAPAARSSRAGRAVGEQCTYGIEVHGDRGALAWDFRRMGELQLCLDQDYRRLLRRREYVGPRRR